MYTYICLYLYEYISTHTHTHTHTYIYIYIYMHTDIHKLVTITIKGKEAINLRRGNEWALKEGIHENMNQKQRGQI